MEQEQKAKSTAAPEHSSLKNYTLESSLGEGAFGVVKLGTHNLTGEKVSINLSLS